MKIYILSLESDFERRQKVCANLDQLGLEYEVFWAVDGRKGLPMDMEQQVDRKAAQKKVGRELGDGELACALSHRLIYEKMLANNIERALILEDDVTVSGELLSLFESKSYIGHHLLLLNHNRAYVWPFYQKKLFGKFVARRLTRSCWMASAYIIDRVGAEYLLSHSRPIQSVADWPGVISEIGASVCHPMFVDHPAVTQSGHHSHLHQERRKTRKKKNRLSMEYWRMWLIRNISRRVS